MTNRLARESSPYLLQHAHNPVDWYPWGDEAFARARAEDRPVLLSIGYSACHWCHVMERESFEDPSIAALMNKLFVNVKVDREERPDLDHIYQWAVQMMGRSGGWPLTVFLTPDKKPFFGGTYFPPTPRYGIPDFPTVLRAVSEAWTRRRAEIERTATELTADIERVTSARAPASEVPRDAARRAAMRLARDFDETHGGFGGRPKFPNTMALDLMLRAADDGDEMSLVRVRKTLDAMRAGGIWDQLGGGFHRYSTDERWMVPHFEKMLYDNALLARLYTDAWRITGDGLYAETVREILGWAVREMRDPEGAFYATQDADSEGEEGKFFVWTREEFQAVLDEREAALAELVFGVTEAGNWDACSTAAKIPCTVLHRNLPIEAAARRLGFEPEHARALFASARRKLFEAREKRPKPFRDEKVIASWNGLMISACAEAGAAFDDPDMIALARSALATVRARLWDGRRLYRIWKDGAARIPAFLDDHADLAGAAIDVAEASDDHEALEFARALVEAAIDRFWDEGDGSFTYAPKDADDLIARPRDAYDHAVPSGSSSIAHALLRLAAHFDVPRYEAIAERLLRSHAGSAIDYPMSFGHLIGAMDRLVRGATEIVIVAEKGDPAGQALLREARRAFCPNRVLARIDPATGEGGLASRLGGRRHENGVATAYVCRKRTCGLPITTPEALRAALEREAGTPA
jgi:uncharacterized protein YyaL (SSP411 family)